jgi:hypothetical protein
MSATTLPSRREPADPVSAPTGGAVTRCTSIARTRQEHIAGTANPRAKLAEDDVREIRSLLAAGISQTAIGLRFDIAQTAISRIKLGRGYVGVGVLAPREDSAA